jgi:lysozyme
MNHELSTIEFIKSTREYVTTPLPNVRGDLVLGWQHKLSPSEINSELLTWSSEYSDYVLVNDLIKIDKALKKLITTDLTQSRYNAIVSLVYDIGILRFKLSGIVELLNKVDHLSVESQFKRWGGYLKNKNYTLVKLRKLEAELYVKGNK